MSIGSLRSSAPRRVHHVQDEFARRFVAAERLLVLVVGRSSSLYRPLPLGAGDVEGQFGSEPLSDDRSVTDACPALLSIAITDQVLRHIVLLR